MQPDYHSRLASFALVCSNICANVPENLVHSMRLDAVSNQQHVSVESSAGTGSLIGAWQVTAASVKPPVQHTAMLLYVSLYWQSHS